MSARPAGALPGAPPQRLRTVFCTRGGLFGAVVLRRLRACEELDICAIVRSSRIVAARLGPLRGALTLVRRTGFAYSLYLLCATSLADLLSGISTARAGAARRAVPVHTTADINTPGGLGFLAGCAPDLLVSAYFDQRLHEAALALPRYGCVNIHPALLPSFRGVDPVLQARLRGAAVGVTVHRMTAKLDEGPVLAQRAVAVPERASIFAATAVLFGTGAELLVAELGRIVRGERGEAQTSCGSYQGWPSRAEVRALRARGTRLMRFADLRTALRAPSSK